MTAALVSGALVAVQQRVTGSSASTWRRRFCGPVSFGTGARRRRWSWHVRAAATWPSAARMPVWTRLAGLGGATLVAVGEQQRPRRSGGAC
jgi:uncharacterized membrane protein YdcZ (DUF606 family)